jgi:hypothetical protein
MNRSEDALSFVLRIDGDDAVATLPAHSIATFLA